MSSKHVHGMCLYDKRAWENYCREKIQTDPNKNKVDKIYEVEIRTEKTKKNKDRSPIFF
ncbi:hypothetical protein PFDG_05005, partial [Plasmodium falciparum Dd2]